MASKTSAIPRREPRKDSAIAAFSRSGQQSQSASSSVKTKLPVPSQPTPATTLKAHSKKHLHSRSLAAPNIRTIKSPRPHSAPSNPKAKDGLEVVEASHRGSSNILTPTSAKCQPPRKSSPGRFSTPKAPKKEAQPAEISTMVTKPQTPTFPAKSPYLHAHVGDACIQGALVHQLICNHKVITRMPEQCKSNCQRPLPEYVEKYTNSKDEGKAFICAGCVEEYVENHRQAKRVMFLESMAKMKGRMDGISKGWVESQLEYWERVWQNEMQKERTEFAKLGDICACIPGEPGAVNSPLAEDGGRPSSLPLSL